MSNTIKVGALLLILLLGTVACDGQGTDPSKDGTCHPAYNENGEPERGAAGQECTY